MRNNIKTKKKVTILINEQTYSNSHAVLRTILNRLKQNEEEL